MADRLVDFAHREQTPGFPLTLQFCEACSLVQIAETLAPEYLFAEDYRYFSSFSDELLRHSEVNAESLIQSEELGPTSLVIEIGSNDGYMLKNFSRHGIPVLGIDPAHGPCAVANQAGIKTRNDFFTPVVADDLARQGQRADLIIANNVLAHVADTNGIIAGIAKLLKPDGLVCFEFPYIRDLVERCEFDTIYHQHLCYFSLRSAQQLMQRHGLVVHGVQRLAIHGGSLRLFVSHQRRPDESVQRLLQDESESGMNTFSWYGDFASQVAAICAELRSLISELIQQNATIAAYGASAKGTTLLGTLKLPAHSLLFVADRNCHKHGMFMPCGQLRISGVEEISKAQPDYLLLLAWNFLDEILEQQQAFRRRGGKFIVPIPEVRVI